MDQLRLLRAENAFYRTSAAVRQSGLELQQVRGFLLQELLAIEVEKRGRLDREASEAITKLQVMLLGGPCATVVVCINWNVLSGRRARRTTRGSCSASDVNCR